MILQDDAVDCNKYGVPLSNGGSYCYWTFAEMVPYDYCFDPRDPNNTDTVWILPSTPYIDCAYHFSGNRNPSGARYATLAAQLIAG